jgi:hypothetical protein
MFSNTKISPERKDNDMMIDLDDLNIDYQNNKDRDAVMDNEQYGVYVSLECFALIRELINVCNELRAKVHELRNEVNDLTPDDENVPYPVPMHDIPGNSFYITKLIRMLYEGIFDEEAWLD